MYNKNLILVKFFFPLSAVLGVYPAYLIDDSDDLDPTNESFFQASLQHLRMTAFDIDVPEEADHADAAVSTIENFVRVVGKSALTSAVFRYPKTAYDFEAAWDAKPKMTLAKTFLANHVKDKTPCHVAVRDKRVLVKVSKFKLKTFTLCNKVRCEALINGRK